jgi:hypothetical protein
MTCLINTALDRSGRLGKPERLLHFLYDLFPNFDHIVADYALFLDTTLCGNTAFSVSRLLLFLRSGFGAN